MSLIKLSLVQNNLDQGENLVSDISAGDGKTANLFQSVAAIRQLSKFESGYFTEIHKRQILQKKWPTHSCPMPMLVIDRVRGVASDQRVLNVYRGSGLLAVI
jgi:hypothetical protein